ncbi:hypothetical protein CPter291_1216 [Collimonas pratensis]|uniref:Uncharacterized protein n=1 Tax=Collimonas pratensis TaxID=279113 RepID=A0ABN4MD37_9BURK|nr:hypothetical protein CPter291_1216 [Collimonas pratensis]
MAGISFLYSVHCQCADCIGHLGSRKCGSHGVSGRQRLKTG